MSLLRARFNHRGLSDGGSNLSPGRAAQTIEVLAAVNDQITWIRQKGIGQKETDEISIGGMT